ncbi:MAG: HTH domain-containing protein [Verrucomicrobiaceae bacterium]|nr:HTH domain-containing protein [Verrucomicrobiaceae bacterium]
MWTEIAKILNKSRTTIHKIIKDIRSYMCEFR